MNEKIVPGELSDEEWFDLPEDVRQILYQPLIRMACTDLQNWRHCPLSRCRRSRTCAGSDVPSWRDARFPPCIVDDNEDARFRRWIQRFAETP